MKKYLLILLCFFLIFFVSCNDEDSLDGGYVDEYPDSSVMKVTFKGESHQTTGAVYQMDFNKDDKSLSTENYILELKHTFEGQECPYGWEFVSEDLKISNKTDKSCSINATELKGLGTYTIKAKSELSDETEEFDKIFIINVTSALSDIVIDYQIQPEYKKNNLVYTDDMVSGTITKFTKNLTLVAGAVYNLTVRDASEEGLSITNVIATKNNNNISFREIYDNTAELVCKQIDNVSSTFNIRVGSSAVMLSCQINLKDISNSYLTELVPTSNAEQVISLEKNPETEKDKKYTYQIITDSVLDDREVRFSIDFEDWGRDTEELFVQKKLNLIPEGERNWFRQTILTRSFEGNDLFRIETDGALGTFSITPLEDTTFESLTKGKTNLHCYLYVRYKEDDPSVVRFKWRIMIGGLLEGLDLYTVDVTNNQETYITNDIAVKEGDEAGWAFRAKYIPATTENTKTLWYISSSKTPYRYSNGVQEFFAPKPVSNSDEANMIKNKVINMMEGVSAVPYNTLSSYKNSDNQYFICDYYFLDNTNNGYSDLWCNYNSFGEDIVLVALNEETKIYTCVGIKDLADKQITIKSLNANSVKSYYSTSQSKSISTLYTENGEQQKYPQTVTEGFEKFRTFYMDVNETLKLEVNSAFKMENFDVYGDSEAREIFPSLSADLDINGMSGVITFKTLYTVIDADRQKPELKQDCLTDGVTVYLRINNSTKSMAMLRIVVYDKDHR